MEENILNKLTSFIYRYSLEYGYSITFNQINFCLIFISLPFVWKLFSKIFNIIILYRTKNDLSPFIERSEIANATKYFVTTKAQNISPANELEPRNSHSFTAKIRIIPFYINLISKNNNESKHFLILADSGMGKSTFLINLYFKYTRLLFLRRYKMVLVPLANPTLMNILKKSKTKKKLSCC